MMSSLLWGAALLACAAALHGQAPAAPPDQAGMETAWEIAPVLQEVSAHAGRLLPALDKVNAAAWVQKGASDTYAVQLESCKAQARALAAEAKALSTNPEKLSAGLQVLFRIQGLDTMLGSLEEGMRKYQGPAEAQALASLAAENGAGRERLQHYIVNLAAEKEQDLQVMDREAQRCRGLVTQAPPPARARKKE